MQYIYIHKNTTSVKLALMNPVENIKFRKDISYTTTYFKSEINGKKNNLNISASYVNKKNKSCNKKCSDNLLLKEQSMSKNITIPYRKRNNLFNDFLDFIRENGLPNLSFEDFTNVVYSDVSNITVDNETNKTVLSDITLNVEYGKDSYYPIIVFNKPLKEISNNITIYDPRNTVAKYISFDENFSYFKINKFISKPLNVNFIIEDNFVIKYRIKMRLQNK